MPATGILQGFETRTLRNAAIELVAIPSLGARIVSLRNRRTTREWLWHPGSELCLFRNEPTDPFERSPLAGWDECLPTIAACDWQGRCLPDHGEAWNTAWAVDERAWHEGALRTTLRLPITPFTFERTIRLDGARVHFAYRLENQSPLAERFLWAPHPLLRLEPGDQLELSSEARTSFIAESAPVPADSPLATGVRSLTLQDLDPAHAKVFAGPLTEGRLAVHNSRSGDGLEFEWDTDLHPFLGIWLTRGGWRGHHHLALEPTNTTTDSLAAAAAAGQSGVAAAQATLDWTLTLSLEPASS